MGGAITFPVREREAVSNFCFVWGGIEFDGVWLSAFGSFLMSALAACGFSGCGFVGVPKMNFWICLENWL